MADLAMVKRRDAGTPRDVKNPSENEGRTHGRAAAAHCPISASRSTILHHLGLL
jgi:hypothetical protein